MESVTLSPYYLELFGLDFTADLSWVEFRTKNSSPVYPPSDEFSEQRTEV